MGFYAYAMKTQFISAYNYYPKYNLSQKEQTNIQVSRPVLNIQPKSQVNFTGRRSLDFFIRNLHLDPLLHFEKYTKEEYARLSLREIENLRARSLDFLQRSNVDTIKAVDDIHSVVPQVLKDMFDKFFGAGEYVVITLGRSLSTIGQALGYRIGENNVVNLPMSWSRRFLPESTRVCDHFEAYRKITSHNERLDKFLAYLEKIGLGKEQVKNSGKSYVLIDYCSSGDSLKGAEFLFKSDYVWGPESKVYAVDVLDALAKYDIPEFESVQLPGIPLLSKSFCASHLKAYSKVGRSLSLGETEKAVSMPVKLGRLLHKEREFIWFRILDNAMQPQQYQPRLNSLDGEFKLSGQTLLPWNDYLSQAESDIRNHIQRVNFQLSKLDVLDVYDSAMRRDLSDLYNNLTDYYNTYKRNPYSMIEYYQSQNKIQKILKKAETVLAGKDIFAQ